jgi:hypothetical protein
LHFLTDYWFVILKVFAVEQCANIKFCVLLHKSLSQTLQMLEEEEAHGKVARKERQVV